MSRFTQQIVLLALGLLSLMVAVWFLLSWNNMLDHYHSMAALPFVYGLELILLSKCPSLNIFKTAAICSYSIKLLLTPWFITTIGERELQTGIHLSVYDNISDAVILQLLEIISVSIYLYHLPNKNNVQKNTFTIAPHQKTWRILMLIGIIAFSLITIYPQFLYKFQPIYMDKEEFIVLQDLSLTVKDSMNLYVYHLGFWVVMLAKLLLVYVLIYILYKYSKGGNWFSLTLSFIVVFASCSFVTSDRAATIYTAIVGLMLIYKVYSKYRVFVSRFSTVFTVAGIFFIFIYSAIFTADDAVAEVGYKLNAYFSGTLNVAACFEMDRTNLFETLMGDVLRNIPLVVGFFVNLPMSYIEFNRALGYDIVYNSQILPAIGQGYYYLGVFGVVVVPIIMFRIAYYLYNHIRFARDSFEYFAYLVALIYIFLGVNLYDLFLTMGLVLQYCVPMLAICLYSYLFNNNTNEKCSDIL